MALDVATQGVDDAYVNDDGSPATWLHDYTSAERARRGLGPVIVGAILAGLLWLKQYEVHMLSENWIPGFVVFVIATLIGAARFGTPQVRHYSRVASMREVPWSQRFREARQALIFWAALEVLGAIAALSLSDESRDSILILLCLPLSFLLAAALVFLGVGDIRLTPRARAAKRYYASRQAPPTSQGLGTADRSVLSSMKQSWVHYPMMAFALTIFVGGLYLAFVLVAALPVSVAVVIGALIIAGAVANKG